MSLSIILSYHEEGQSFLEECIKQVRDSVRIFPFELIVVDDCSKVPLDPIENVTILRTLTRQGIGASFDYGVSCANYNTIFFMACDTRYIDNGWSEKLYREIQLHPKSLICTTCVGINAENMDINLRKDDSKHSGATILIFHDHKSNPRKPEHFRGLVEAKWLPYSTAESHEVPCILGACYGTTKVWYQYIDGFWGHKIWGNLEPLISMKSYLFGGSCRVVPAETGHIFKPITSNTHNIPQSAVCYNKLLIATLLFPDSQRLINFLGVDFNVLTAQRQIQSNIAQIIDKKRVYKEKTVLSMEEYISKFSLDYRK